MPYSDPNRKCTDTSSEVFDASMGFQECLSAVADLGMEFVMYTSDVGGRCRYGPTCDNTISTGYNWRIYRINVSVNASTQTSIFQTT